MELRFLLQVEKRCQASCQVEVVSGVISRGAMGLSVLHSCRELIPGVTFQSCQWNAALIQVDGDIGVLSNGGTTPGVPLEFQGETGLHLSSTEHRDSFADEAGDWTLI